MRSDTGAGPSWPMAAVAALLESAGDSDLRRWRCDALTAEAVAAAWGLIPAQRRWIEAELGPWAARNGVESALSEAG